MKKILLFASVVFVVLFGALQVYINLHQPTPSDELRVRAAELPPLALTTLDGKPFQIPDNTPVVLVYFNSTCDHCQRQLEAMQKEAARFAGAEVIWMSSQSPEDLKVYFDKGQTGLFTVVRVQPEEVAERFGVLALPQIFVFGADGKLRELFTGETDPQEIRMALP